MTLLHLFNMQAIPPAIGAGRVHRLSDRQPGSNRPETSPLLKKTASKQPASVTRTAILQAIADGCELRKEVAEEVGISTTSVDKHCTQLIIDGMIRVTRSKIATGQIMNRYRIKGDGLLALANGGLK